MTKRKTHSIFPRVFLSHFGNQLSWHKNAFTYKTLSRLRKGPIRIFGNSNAFGNWGAQVACTAGAILGGASSEDLRNMEVFSESIGLAFQGDEN